MIDMAKDQTPDPATPEVDPDQLGIEDALGADHDPGAGAPDPAPAPEPAPEPLTVDQIALLIADLDEDQQRGLVHALDVLDVLVGTDAVRERPSRDGLEAGDYVDLDGHAYVRFPDGSVTTASRQLLVSQPGEYSVEYWGPGQGSETFTVAEKGDKA